MKIYSVSYLDSTAELVVDAYFEDFHDAVRKANKINKSADYAEDRLTNARVTTINVHELKRKRKNKHEQKGNERG